MARGRSRRIKNTLVWELAAADDFSHHYSPDLSHYRLRESAASFCAVEVSRRSETTACATITITTYLQNS